MFVIGCTESCHSITFDAAGVENFAKITTFPYDSMCLVWSTADIKNEPYGSYVIVVVICEFVVAQNQSLVSEFIL